MSIVLSLDTSTRLQCAAIVHHGQVRDAFQKQVRDHGSTLLTHIDQLLNASQVKLSDVDLIAVSLGPGGFTSLRIGLAVAKGLARVHDIDLVGVSSLACAAYRVARARANHFVCAANDARRTEVFAGLYRFKQDTLNVEKVDQGYRPSDVRVWLEELATHQEISLVGTATAAYPELKVLETHPNIRVIPPAWVAPDAVVLAQLGQKQYREGGADALYRLEPNYIRPSDAEANFEKRGSQK